MHLIVLSPNSNTQRGNFSLHIVMYGKYALGTNSVNYSIIVYLLWLCLIPANHWTFSACLQKTYLSIDMLFKKLIKLCILNCGIIQVFLFIYCNIVKISLFRIVWLKGSNNYKLLSFKLKCLISIFGLGNTSS